MTSATAAISTRDTSLDELLRWAKAAHLLDADMAFFVRVIAGILVGIAVCAVALTQVDTWQMRLAINVPFSCMIVQMGFVGHYCGHRQLPGGGDVNDFVATMFLPLVGVSPTMWRVSHNEHHDAPNDLERDLKYRFLFVFTREQLEGRGPVGRFLAKSQAFWFIPVATVEPTGLQLASIPYVIANRKWWELLGLVGYVGLYAGFLIPVLGWQDALVFFLIHRMITNLYMDMVFAPNHKGCEIIPSDEVVDDLSRQLRTTRNAGYGNNWFVTTLFGGLNYQIAHHICPWMAPNKLGRFDKIVEQYCREEGLPFHAASVTGSYKEMFASLHEEGNRPLPARV